MSAPPLDLSTFTPAPLGGVEAELERQFHAEQDVGGPPIQRARLSNLVIYCDRGDKLAEVAAALPSIVRAHPARVIGLQVEPSEAEPTAGVLVRTRYAHGTQEIGYEAILLRAGGRGVERLPGLVRGLLIGDLPTNLWWAAETPPPLAGPLLYSLSEHAQQVVYDSFGWPQPARGIAATASWLDKFERDAGDPGGYRVAADLTWRRLKSWRRLLGQALDPAVAPGALESVSEVVVEHGPHSVMFAWGLASWLAQGLGWEVVGARVQPAVEIDWQFRSPRGPRHMRIRRLADAPRGIRRIHIACAGAGGPCTLVLAPDDDGRRLAIVAEGCSTAPRTLTLDAPGPAELVARQLSDRDRDPAFRRAMVMAQSLAQRVLGA